MQRASVHRKGGPNDGSEIWGGVRGADPACTTGAGMTATYDAIIIGTGQAGPFLAHRLTSAGMRVAIIERGAFGGTCVNTGCIPTKALVASAYAAHMVRRASDFGVNVGPAAVDMKRVKARKDAIAGQSRIGVETWLETMERCTVYRAHARFESRHAVRLGADRLTAERIFINVGGRAAVPRLPGVEQIEYLTNSSMMQLDFVPRHLIVVGGSYVGLEFGQMLRRFGSEVTIIEMAERLIHREDDDVSATVQDILEREGVVVRLNATCIGFAKRGGDIVAHVDCAQGAREVTGTHVLLAVGRRPNTDDLGLDEAGVATDERGYIVVDDQRRVSDRILTYGLFIDPPLGRAGLTDAEVRKSGRPALVGKRPMERVKRAVEKGETQGFMKIVVDAETRAILGAAILGTGGDEVIHSILDVMYAKAPYTTIQRAMHIHPTVSELIPTMLGELKPLS